MSKILFRNLFAALFLVVTLVAKNAFAAGAPAAAINKTITITFTINGMARRMHNNAEYGYSNTITRTMYISAAGRIFSKINNQSGQGRASSVDEVAPDRSSGGSFRFQGNNLTGVVPFENGARQVTINFDPSFTSCSAKMIEGRIAGKVERRKSPTGEMVEILSTTIGNPSCSIRAGNGFAGG